MYMFDSRPDTTYVWLGEIDNYFKRIAQHNWKNKYKGMIIFPTNDFEGIL